MVKVLITGGAGFISSSLAEKLLSFGNFQVVLVDNFVTGNSENIPVHENCIFIKCDVNDFDDIAPVMIAYRFDYVFHYAALVGVLRTLQNPVKVLDDVEGIRNVLRLSKNTGVKRIFYSSSSEVYGEPVAMPQHEFTTPLNSRLPYAVVKNIGEAYCRSYLQEFKLDYTIFRFFNTYGPKQSQDFVMSKFINAALANEDITVYGDGLQSRTFCYIDDNVDTCIKILLDDKYKNDVYNIGSNQEITIWELANTIIKLTGSGSKVIHLPPLKEGDMTKRQPDISKMTEILGRELISFKDGIIKILMARGIVSG